MTNQLGHVFLMSNNITLTHHGNPCHNKPGIRKVGVVALSKSAAKHSDPFLHCNHIYIMG
jgi:hypothetical protein